MRVKIKISKLWSIPNYMSFIAEPMKIPDGKIVESTWNAPFDNTCQKKTLFVLSEDMRFR